MKIAFDAKRAFFNNSGLGNYSRGVINCLNTYYPELDLYLLSPDGNEKLTGDFATKNEVHLFTGILKKYKRIKQSAILAQKADVDIFHGLSNELPTGLSKKKIKSVVTIHDLIFLKYPKYYNSVDRKIYLAKTKYAIRHADLVVTTSNQTTADIDQVFGAGNKCKTIYQHVSQFDNQKFIKPGTDNYLLYISSFEKRKNHLNLLEAFASMASKTDMNMVLIGRPRETFSEVEERIQTLGLTARVTLIPNASSEQLMNYLAGSSGFIYPSFYEGFGIPLLEAMQMGVPIACSSIPVFHEIAHPETLFFDPNSIGEISNALLKLVANKPQNRNIDTAHLKKFSSETHAKTLHDCYLNLV